MRNFTALVGARFQMRFLLKKKKILLRNLSQKWRLKPLDRSAKLSNTNDGSRFGTPERPIKYLDYAFIYFYTFVFYHDMFTKAHKILKAHQTRKKKQIEVLFKYHMPFLKIGYPWNLNSSLIGVRIWSWCKETLWGDVWIEPTLSSFHVICCFCRSDVSSIWIQALLSFWMATNILCPPPGLYKHSSQKLRLWYSSRGRHFRYVQ